MLQASAGCALLLILESTFEVVDESEVPHWPFFLRLSARAGPRETPACIRTRLVVNNTKNCIMCFSLPEQQAKLSQCLLLFSEVSL